MQLTVTTTIPSKNTEGNIWFVFEVDGSSFDEIHDRLVEDGALLGHRIETRRQGRLTVEAARVQHTLGINGVATMRPCHITIDGVA